MTRDETKNIIGMMASAWPNFSPANIRGTIDLWAGLMEPYPYQVILAALRSYMVEDHAFAPAPGQLLAYLPKEDGGRSDLEAWSLVRKALCNGNYGAEDEFAKLPPDVQRAVGSPAQLRAWAAAPSDELETVMQSNFLRTYRAVKTQVHNDNLYQQALLRMGAGAKAIEEEKNA